MKPLKLGIIGMSEGNGHPYSWAAIFNGYDHGYMQCCEFPIILEYLAKRKFPEDILSTGRVTHIWTQDRSKSEQIARASKIETVVDSFVDMIGHIDGVLLARDDAENHFYYAKPFIEASLPIYIDKPIALSREGLDSIYQLQKYPGQIFTCSALAYAKEFQLSADVLKNIGVLKCIQATTPKSWAKYAVHIIEPMLKLIGNEGKILQTDYTSVSNNGSILYIKWESGFWASISALGDDVVAPLSLRLIGSENWQDLILKDSFAAFKAALADFTEGVIHSDVRTDPMFVQRVVSLLEKGNPSQ